ncbi:MAG TPA: tetratricopeptide repeat protein [Devosia sp.]|nr:tetratricopeptide repeat protein [Devosia sp.]
MRIYRARPFASVIIGSALLASSAVLALAQEAADPASITAQNAIDAAQELASALDGAGGGISNAAQVAALEAAAAAGDPSALWQLGNMYENGEGVPQDKAKAFGYFAQIADQHADAAPSGFEGDIVGHSFVKMGQYYAEGLPEADVPKDESESLRLILYAATYFGDADAQFRVGLAYQNEEELGDNPLQSARWLKLAAEKGHPAAEARLGDLMFNGSDGVQANPVRGLMWLTVASRRAVGSVDAEWIGELLNSAMSVATPVQREQAIMLADAMGDSLADL